MNKTKTFLKSLSILFVFALAIQVSAVWTEPPSTPPAIPPYQAPNNNTPPPVNVGENAQMKQGAFGAQGIRAVGPLGLGLFDTQVGIGSVSGAPHMPATGIELDVLGDIKFSGALMASGSAGNATEVLKSQGPGLPALWGASTGMTNPMTTIGDMIYASASGTPATAERLGIGSAGQVLTVNASGLPSWATSGGGGYWSRTSATPFYTYLTNSGDKVGIGTSVPTQQLQITGNFEIPHTNSSATAGVIYKGGVSFLHNNGIFDATGSIKKQSIFMGANAGNFGANSSCLSNNIGIGIEALKNITSSSSACAVPAASSNIGIGNIALTNLTKGTGNVAVGASAVGSITTGEYNVGVGSAALSSSTGTATGNVGVGYNAGVGTGNGNTYVGAYACNIQNSGNSGTVCNLVTGTNNTVLGYQAKAVGGTTNSTVIGNGAEVDVSNKVRIGNTSISWIGGQVAWSPASDARYKINIKDTDLGLDFINSLRPVSYKMKTDGETDGVSYGLIAQEVEEALGGRNTKIISRDNSPEAMMSLRYNDLMAPMIKAIQEQQKQIEELKAEIEILKNK